MREADTINSGFDPEFVDSSEELGYDLGLQDKYEEAEKCFTQSIAFISKFTDTGAGANLTIQLGNRDAILKHEGRILEAEEVLCESLANKKELQDVSGVPELLVWLGELYELKSLHEDCEVNLSKAESNYVEVRKYENYRPYFDVGALTGRVRVKHGQGDYAAIPSLLAKADQLAQQYEYNDYLASLRLTQGMIASEGQPIQFDTVLNYFKQAMVYALRYNRFLLDEVISG